MKNKKNVLILTSLIAAIILGGVFYVTAKTGTSNKVNNQSEEKTK